MDTPSKTVAGEPVADLTFAVRQIGEMEIGDGEDIFGVVLEGDHAAVKAAGRLFGERVSILPASALASMQEERDEARRIVRDIHWMAVRYADGRLSYAPGMCNDAIRKAYDAGWLTYTPHPQHDHDPQYAREGDKPEYQSLQALETALQDAKAEGERLRKALEPFAVAGDAMRMTGGKNPKMSGPRMAEHLERARAAYGPVALTPAGGQ